SPGRGDWSLAPGAAREASKPGVASADGSQSPGGAKVPPEPPTALGNPTVLLTAGASAPEDLVAEVCRTLVARFGATIEQRDVFEEDVYFAPPAGLRRQMQARGIDPTPRRIHVSKPEITPEVYGAVPLTVSAGKGG